ncbi:HD-GYP domain-containing protein [Arsukibacterium sp.]|uniref:HD-GYP domain-containing protein n=1 Tax=Arsukibacterium sp. TaxID=1977258 RepID=UPI002FD8E3F7
MAYQHVSIADLAPGSYVVAVTQQTGEISVKHAGWVRSAAAINMLREKGVLQVLVDPARQLHTSTLQPVPAAEDPISFQPEGPVRSLFVTELPRAERLLKQSTRLQQSIQDAARQQKPIDLSLVHEVSAGISESVMRNQDVLLCLTRIAEQSDSLLQHSLNCAVYLAAFSRFLNLPSHKVEALITAGLLHDVGKALDPELLGKPDAQAINTSLLVLQRNKNLAGEISLWISQHCALLDGSGAPPIKGQQIHNGSRMLAIVNRYENLTNPQQGLVNPAAASAQLLKQTPAQLDSELVQLFIKCIGIYPPGSVVKLSTGKLALVLENNSKNPTKPKVKLFYHSVHQHHIPPKVLDLARQQEEQIEACVDLRKYGLDVRNYF